MSKMNNLASKLSKISNPNSLNLKKSMDNIELQPMSPTGPLVGIKQSNKMKIDPNGKAIIYNSYYNGVTTQVACLPTNKRSDKVVVILPKVEPKALECKGILPKGCEKLTLISDFDSAIKRFDENDKYRLAVVIGQQNGMYLQEIENYSFETINKVTTFKPYSVTVGEETKEYTPHCVLLLEEQRLFSEPFDSQGNELKVGDMPYTFSQFMTYSDRKFAIVKGFDNAKTIEPKMYMLFYKITNTEVDDIFKGILVYSRQVGATVSIKQYLKALADNNVLPANSFKNGKFTKEGYVRLGVAIEDFLMQAGGETIAINAKEEDVIIVPIDTFVEKTKNKRGRKLVNTDDIASEDVDSDDYDTIEEDTTTSDSATQDLF